MQIFCYEHFDSIQTAAHLNKKNALIRSNRTFDNKTRHSGYIYKPFQIKLLSIYHVAIRGCLI